MARKLDIKPIDLDELGGPDLVDQKKLQPNLANIKRDGPVSRSAQIQQQTQIPAMPKNYKLEPKFYEAYYQYKNSESPQTRANLLKQLQPIIDTAVYSYASGNSPAIRAQAKREALKALKTYNPARGPLKSHILSALRRLNRTSGKAYHGISLPEQLLRDRTMLQAAEEDLRIEFGRDPSDGELADKTGLSLKRIKHIRAAGGETAESSIKSPEGLPYSPPSVIPGQESYREELTLKMLYHDLDGLDQAILDHTYGWNNKPILSNTQVAKKLNITPAAVSQRRAKIQKKLFDSGLHQLL